MKRIDQMLWSRDFSRWGLFGLARTAGLAGTLGLAGCAVGPNYHAPETRAPARWAAPLAGGETNQPAELSVWWKNFGDTNLNALMTAALHSNLDLRMAAARVREARAQRDVAAGGLWPSVAGSAGYSRNRWGQDSFPPIPAGVPLDYNLYNAGFDAAWELDVFGGTRRAVEAANAKIGAAEFGRREAQVSLLAEVARSYVEARGFQRRRAITQRNLAVQKEILNLTRSRFQSGLSSDLDVQQATALLTATEARLPSLETGLHAAVAELAVLLGQPPGALAAEFARTNGIPSGPPTVPAGLPSDLLRRRPDVRRAERELAAATAGIGVATADLFPKFSLTGLAGWETLSADNWFDYAGRYWTAGPTVQWNLFEAGRIRANIRVQNARQEQALAAYQQTVLVALKDVDNALTAYAQEQARHQSLARSTDADAQALALANELYQKGLADFLRVLDSERSLYETQDALIQSEQTISLDLVQLYKALGGGWDGAPLSASAR